MIIGMGNAKRIRKKLAFYQTGAENMRASSPQRKACSLRAKSQQHSNNSQAHHNPPFLR